MEPNTSSKCITITEQRPGRVSISYCLLVIGETPFGSDVITAGRSLRHLQGTGMGDSVAIAALPKQVIAEVHRVAYCEEKTHTRGIEVLTQDTDQQWTVGQQIWNDMCKWRGYIKEKGYEEEEMKGYKGRSEI